LSRHINQIHNSLQSTLQSFHTCIINQLISISFFLHTIITIYKKKTYSEDYYGDLDLKSIRKSELLAGLAGNPGPKSKTAAANKKASPQKADN
jgi:hypothetical protein